MAEVDLVAELAAAIADTLREGDLAGHLAAWARVVAGVDTPNTLATACGEGTRPLGKHQDWILRHAQEKGGITSGELAQAHHVHPETARLVLVRMCKEGLLTRHGAQRGTWYSAAQRG